MQSPGAPMSSQQLSFKGKTSLKKTSWAVCWGFHQIFSCLKLNQNLTGHAIFILKFIHVQEQLWLWLGAPQGGWFLLAWWDVLRLRVLSFLSSYEELPYPLFLCCKQFHRLSRDENIGTKPWNQDWWKKSSSTTGIIKWWEAHHWLPAVDVCGKMSTKEALIFLVSSSFALAKTKLLYSACLARWTPEGEEKYYDYT